ncbi:hypothetical protein [Streptomyces anulatus]|uniref:hypothetical protein n=1 Tax=Streptomyces anulatus TaxID=1892 RepID=UPI001D192B15|nr:hypothetical protein [Streptomyces anulatus]
MIKSARAFLPASESRGHFRLAVGLFSTTLMSGDGRPALLGVVTFRASVDSALLTTSFPWLIPFEQCAELGSPALTCGVPPVVEQWFVAQAVRVAAGRGVMGVAVSSAVMGCAGRASASARVLVPGFVPPRQLGARVAA